MKLSIVFAVSMILTLPVHGEEASLNGKTIFETRCGDLCHQLPQPDMLEEKQWIRVLETMQTRMQQRGLQLLTQNEKKAVLGYLVNSGH